MSTERISRLQNLLDRIKKNAAAAPKGAHLVLGGTQASITDVSTGPAVPAARSAERAPQTDVATAPMAPIRAIEVDVPPSAMPSVMEGRTPTLTGAAHVPTISGMNRVEAEVPAQVEPVEDVIEELDIDDADVVDITTEPPPAPSSVDVGHVVAVEGAEEVTDEASAPAQEVTEDDLNWSEPPVVHEKLPDSSPRPRATAASLDEALADAVEAESTEPLKTPPPESGRQPAEGIYAVAIPTPEQLGETVDLEAPTSAEIELDLSATQAKRPKEELEFDIPPRPSMLEMPVREPAPSGTSEIEDTSQPEKSRVRGMPEEVDTVETPAYVAQQDTPEPSTDRDSLPPAAELTTRNTAGRQVTPEYVFAARKFAPRTFSELLDASLSLVPKQ